MCYLIAKNIDDEGCVALRTTHGKHLSSFKKSLMEKVGYDKIQLVTISRPSAYEEYEPYRFGKSEVELSITIYILQRVQIQGLIDWNNHLQFRKNPLGTLGNKIPRNKKSGKP